MIPKNQQLLLVPEMVDLQRADDGNLILVSRDHETGLMIGIVLGPKLAKELGEKMIAPSVTVVRHSLPPDIAGPNGGPH